MTADCTISIYKETFDLNSSALVTISLFCWLIFFLSFNYDRRRYRNCALLFIALVSTVPALCSLAGRYSARVLYFCIIVFCIALLIVPVFLIHNGILMMKREGRSLSNMLSLLLGLVIGLGELSTLLFLLWMENSFGTGRLVNILEHTALINYLISVTVIYGSVAFLMFMLYSVFLMLIPRKSDFDYIIIHGAGLIGGDRVSKLLSDRIDKAIDVYLKDPSPTIMIPSGGQGGDETVSEAEAMSRYMLERGIPEYRIIKEDKSTTTMENLENCKKIIDSMEGRKYTTLVTSNYHVYRALRYCRKIGLDCTGIGSHVAFYYWPSALIREFVAIHSEKKHFVMLVAGWVLWVIIPLIYGVAV